MENSSWVNITPPIDRITTLGKNCQNPRRKIVPFNFLFFLAKTMKLLFHTVQICILYPILLFDTLRATVILVIFLKNGTLPNDAK